MLCSVQNKSRPCSSGPDFTLCGLLIHKSFGVCLVSLVDITAFMPFLPEEKTVDIGGACSLWII